MPTLRLLFGSLLFLFLISTRLHAQQVITGTPGVASERKTLRLDQVIPSSDMALKPTIPAIEAPPPGPGPRNRSRRGPAGAPTAPRPLAPLSPPGVPPTLVSSFAALGDNNTSIPPDTHGAVGLTHLMVTLNTQVRIQDRSGNAISTVSLSAFWTGLFNSRPFDPKVLYDHMANRWMLTVMADPADATSSVLMGVSQTSDPTGVWDLYRIDADATDTSWADYPSMGYNKDWIVVQVNMFTVSGSNFTGSNIYVFDKANLYAGGAGAFTLFQEDFSGGFSQTPAITYDDTLSTMYLLEDWNGNDNGEGLLRLTTITGPVGSEVYTIDVAYPSTTDTWQDDTSPVTNFAPQSETSTKIATNDARLQNTVYRNGALWCTHTVFLPATGTPTRSAVQWWKIDPTGGVLDRGRIDDPSGVKFYAFPSIAVNKDNDVVIGYSRFGADQFASANYAYRSGNDPPGALQADSLLKAGEAKYVKTFGSSRNRWGDYSNTVVDPVDDTGMWTIQQYAALPVGTGSNDDRWGTWWGQLVPTTGTPEISIAPSGLDFGGVGIGEARIRTLTIRNTGDDNLEIGGIISATNAFQFPSAGFTIPVNDSVMVAITFAPDSTETVIDTLFISSNDAATPVVWIPMTAISVRRGDINGDGAVSILDIIQFIRILLEKDPAPAPGSSPFHTADANGDGELDVVDAVRQVNTVLHIVSKQVAPLSQKVYVDTGMMQFSPSGRPAIPILMDAEGPVAAFEAVFTFDATQGTPGTPQLAEKSSRMSVESHLREGALHVVVFSLTGETISRGRGTVLMIPVIGAEGTPPVALTISRMAVADPLARRLDVTIRDRVIEEAVLPDTFALRVNHPNPFNPATAITYDLPNQTHVTLVIYNLLGQEVARLVDSWKPPGRHAALWHGTNNQGKPVASGVYVYRLTTDAGFNASRRMTLLR